MYTTTCLRIKHCTHAYRVNVFLGDDKMEILKIVKCLQSTSSLSLYKERFINSIKSPFRNTITLYIYKCTVLDT